MSAALSRRLYEHGVVFKYCGNPAGKEQVK